MFGCDPAVTHPLPRRSSSLFVFFRHFPPLFLLPPLLSPLSLIFSALLRLPCFASCPRPCGEIYLPVHHRVLERSIVGRGRNLVCSSVSCPPRSPLRPKASGGVRLVPLACFSVLLSFIRIHHSFEGGSRALFCPCRALFFWPTPIK